MPHSHLPNSRGGGVYEGVGAQPTYEGGGVEVEGGKVVVKIVVPEPMDSAWALIHVRASNRFGCVARRRLDRSGGAPAHGSASWLSAAVSCFIDTGKLGGAPGARWETSPMLLRLRSGGRSSCAWQACSCYPARSTAMQSSARIIKHVIWND